MNNDDFDLQPLLGERFARAWERSPADARAPRQRLMQRVEASLRAEAGMVTVRRRRARPRALAEGVLLQTLYRASAALRPGEPRRASLVELAPGAPLPPGLLADDTLPGACHREWLVLEGRVARAGSDEPALNARDYHVTPAGHAMPHWRAEAHTLLFLRESELPATPDDRPLTVRDAEAGWADYAPGIRRRVLWTREGQAAMLYRADAGAAVPRHVHVHDEECLMVEGELFLDDVLLQRGDYQLAPAGSGHRFTATDTGVVIYAHGDLDLSFVD